MTTTNPSRRYRLMLGAAALLLTAAAQAVTIDFRPGFSGNPPNAGNWGNSLTFNAGGVTVTARGYAATGALSDGWNLFQTAQIYKWGTGLGNCNRVEGLANSTCDSDEHEFDTVGYDDLLVLVFDQTVNFEALTVDPFNGPTNDPNDRDIIYWAANIANPTGASIAASLATRTFNTLGSMPGLAPEVWNQVSSSFNPLTHALSGFGNVLFLSGNWRDINCRNADVSTEIECEAYKIRDVTVTPYSPPVPVPAAAWLFGSALLAAGAVRRRAA